MARSKFYVVFQAAPGCETGIYESWPEAQSATIGVSGSPVQGFKTRRQAKQVWNGLQVETPRAFYVVKGDESGVIHTVWHRAVQAAGGASHQHRVQKFRFRQDAQDYAATFDRSQLPPRLVGAAAGAGRLVLFDTETTGLSPENDQIVELALAVYDDGVRVGEVQRYRFRPTVAEMSEEAEQVHGITMADLQNEEPFSYYADAIRQTFEDADSLMGYNARFDINMVQAEFRRAGLQPLTLVGVSILDPYQIWLNRARRRLQDAHQVFLHAPMRNAHNAVADVVATAHVFNAMVGQFSLSDESAGAIDRMLRGAQVDLEGKFVWNADGEVLFNFGMHRGSSVLDPDCRGYLGWMVFRVRNRHGEEEPRFPRQPTRIASLAASVHDGGSDTAEFFETIHGEFGEPPQEQHGGA